MSYRAAAVTAALAGLAFATSCLVTSSSDFQDPTQLSPPFLSAAGATPPLSSFVLIDNPTTPQEFSATLRSQDNATPLFARLYLDFPANRQGNLLDQDSIPLGALDDQELRRVRLFWTPSATSSSIATPGCHSVTLMVSRSFQTLDPLPENNGDTTDFLVWWVYIPPGVLSPGGMGGSAGGAGAGGAAGGAGEGGAAGTAGSAGTSGASDRADAIEQCLLLGTSRE